MEIAKIYVNGAKAVVSKLKKVPKGIVGATISVTFGNDWDGLTKTAVFQGAVTKDVLDVGNVITIPAECVEESGHRLRVGFYGQMLDTLVIPTLWADLGAIQDAADPSGDTSTDPSLPMWAQLQAQIDHIELIPGPQGPQGIQGPKGDKGDRGAKGGTIESLCVPENEAELQAYLDEGLPVLIVKPFELTKTIVIDKHNAKLEFVEGVEFNMNGKGFPAFQIGSADNPRPTYIRVKNVCVRGDRTAGSVGIYLFGASFAYEIISPRIFGCEYGIKVREEDIVGTDGNTYEHFDCAQQGCIFEPYLGGAKVGLMDAGGGLQNTRIFGGRIEQNDWCVVTSSPNVCFTGSLIQGGTLGEVKILNTTGLGGVRSSGGTFDNCYFEHIKRTGVTDAIFQLGDESQNDGWMGSLNLIGCKFYAYQDDVTVRCNGNALASGESTKTINVIGCSMNGKQLFSLPNVNFGTKILVTGLTNTSGAELPTVGVNADANVQYIHNNYSKFGVVKADAILGTGDFTPTRYMYTKDLRVDNGNGWVSRTASELLPWEDPNVGILTGSMHYCTKTISGYQTPCWFVRVSNKSDADNESKWNSLVLADASGIANKLHANAVCVEQKGASGQWIEITKSPNLPWLDNNVGITPGSLHYCSATVSGYPTPCWFERRNYKNDADAESKWNCLVRANAKGVADYTYTNQLRLEHSGLSGYWAQFTKSSNLPWNDSGAGIVAGSMHFCSNNTTWYIRIGSKGSADDSSKWKKIMMEAAE